MKLQFLTYQKMANFLLTGVAGHIASHIADRLVKQGHLVIGLDDLSSGKLENVNEQVAFFQMDLSEAGILFERYKIDTVIHCAAQVDVLRSVEDPIHDAMENIFGSLALFESMKNAGCKRIIFLSSGGALYQEIDATEESVPKPISPYGIAKYSVENYLLNFYADTHKFLPTVLRLSNVYGPRNNHGIISLALSKFKNKKPLTIYGGGQERDYCHVSDVVSAVDLVVKKNLLGIYNVSTEFSLSLNDLINIIKEANNVPDRLIKYAEYKPGEIMKSSFKSIKLRKEGWKDKIDILTGLANL
jgi:UDP-glucose 4-epimerase